MAQKFQSKRFKKKKDLFNTSIEIESPSSRRKRIIIYSIIIISILLLISITIYFIVRPGSKAKETNQNSDSTSQQQSTNNQSSESTKNEVLLPFPNLDFAIGKELFHTHFLQKFDIEPISPSSLTSDIHQNLLHKFNNALQEISTKNFKFDFENTDFTEPSDFIQSFKHLPHEFSRLIHHIHYNIPDIHFIHHAKNSINENINKEENEYTLVYLFYNIFSKKFLYKYFEALTLLNKILLKMHSTINQSPISKHEKVLKFYENLKNIVRKCYNLTLEQIEPENFDLENFENFAKVQKIIIYYFGFYFLEIFGSIEYNEENNEYYIKLNEFGNKIICEDVGEDKFDGINKDLNKLVPHVDNFVEGLENEDILKRSGLGNIEDEIQLFLEAVIMAYGIITR